MENTDHNLRRQSQKKTLKFNFGQNFIIVYTKKNYLELRFVQDHLDSQNQKTNRNEKNKKSG